MGRPANTVGRVKYTVDPETGCWNWGQAKIWSGYAKMNYLDKTVAAHRFFYQDKYGPIPKHLQIDHLCRNRGCVNPDHMEAVTPEENSRRRPDTKLTLSSAGFIKRKIANRGNRTKSELVRHLALWFRVSKRSIQDVHYGLTWRDA